MRWLAQAMPDGGARVVKVLRVAPGLLELERLPMVPPGQGAGEAFGRALAITHAAGAPYYGAPPAGWQGHGAIGNAPLSFVAKDQQTANWGEFYAQYRIAPYLAPAIRRGALPESAAAVFEKLMQRLATGELDSPQPALVEGVARIHGDLWAGNVLWQSEPWPENTGDWTGATLIDPAAHGGHAETDLAMLALFGVPQYDQIIEGYQAVSPLAEGWTERAGLHQLHPLLVHAVLFGQAYGERAVKRAEECLI
ncbi:MAG: fructosamine kinase family protein [Bifidobacteriaceae bacterium]|nr:fructosamine kinase family protein [Bifidobacteriaceae bacterium]